eukprot:15472071-Alexandrium_andersonii.AAC.1
MRAPRFARRSRGPSAETGGSPTFGGSQILKMTARPFGQAQTATSSSWALAHNCVCHGSNVWRPLRVYNKGLKAL